MKKILLLLSLLAAILPTFAQHVRNKPFDPTLNLGKKTSDEIIRLLGKPEQIDSTLMDGLGVYYPGTRFYFYESHNPARQGKKPVYICDGFETESPDFCILSDCFPGGIKVGDRLERLKQLDPYPIRERKGEERTPAPRRPFGSGRIHHFRRGIRLFLPVRERWDCPEYQLAHPG